MKKIVLHGVPHLCLFAITDINEGQEITYDYGGDDLPWRSKRSIKKGLHQPLTLTTEQSQLVSTHVPSTEGLHQPLTLTTEQSQLVSTHVPSTEVCQYICLLNLVCLSLFLSFFLSACSSGNFISQDCIDLLRLPRHRHSPALSVKTIQGKPLGRGRIRYSSPCITLQLHAPLTVASTKIESPETDSNVEIPAEYEDYEDVFSKVFISP
ncbi:uncharacterized protein [Garra rufa]|uniref:uncharacterized protein n=1 Tax=Garra rufa TaxID=137080 RepID=UPI003CCEDB93